MMMPDPMNPSMALMQQNRMAQGMAQTMPPPPMPPQAPMMPGGAAPTGATQMDPRILAYIQALRGPAQAGGM